MMARFILLGVLLVALVCTAGCFTYDQAHNQSHLYMIKNDLRIIHEDLDFMMGFDTPSHASRSLY